PDVLVAHRHRPSVVADADAAVGPEVGPADARADDPDDGVARFDDRRLRYVFDAYVAGAVHHCPAHQPVTSRACAYSSSVTWRPQVTGLPVSSASCIATCVISRVAAAPCQWFSPGSKKTRSPGRM